jgi:hypothetical protein
MKRATMRTAFTQAEIRSVRQIADALEGVPKQKCFDSYTRWSLALTKICRERGMKGKLSAGEFRMAFVTDRMVIKLAYNSGKNRLIKEAEYIQKMRRGDASRHFPLTQIIFSKNKKIVLLIQERIDMRQGARWILADHVRDLGHTLGIEDVHSGNYGWAGPKHREWPVFIDVDFRRSGRRGTPNRHRSWMVAA